MRYEFHVRLVFTLMMGMTGACGEALTTVRMAPALPLKGGAPVGGCEQDGWHEVVPVRAFAGAQQVISGPGMVIAQTTSREEMGHAVFRPGEDNPENVLDLMPHMQEPSLAELHEGRLKHIFAKRTTATVVTLSGAAIALGGVGAMIPDAINQEVGPAFIAGGTAAIVGLIVELIGVAMAPSPQEQTFAEARKYVFLPGEDDLDAVKRGVGNLNLQRRQACGGDVSNAVVQASTPPSH